MFQNPGNKKSKTQSKPKLEKAKEKQQNEHTCKERENKTTNKRKKSKKKQHISTKKNFLNLIPIHWSNPLSTPYQALIQTLPKSFLTVVQWDVSKPRKKKSKTQSKPKLEKSKRKKYNKNEHTYQKREKNNK